jgi:predicted SnoaL-like aldol condensation-catalyzing enzyme
MTDTLDLTDRKARVQALLEIAFTPGRSPAEKRELMSKLINPAKYIQHSATVPDGFDGLMSLVAGFDDQFPSYGVSVKRLIAEGDWVVAHCHYTYGTPGDLGKAIVEIFRFEDDLMVEHWDVIQDVPAQRANANGMF